jgi:hypothetical protein
MIILRIAFIALVIWIAMRLVRRFMQGRGDARPQDSYRGKMIACEVCGVYLPESDAVARADGRVSCGRH